MLTLLPVEAGYHCRSVSGLEGGLRRPTNGQRNEQIYILRSAQVCPQATLTWDVDGPSSLPSAMRVRCGIVP
jgi:hypothetical protein